MYAYIMIVCTWPVFDYISSNMLCWRHYLNLQELTSHQMIQLHNIPWLLKFG